MRWEMVGVDVLRSVGAGSFEPRGLSVQVVDRFGQVGS